MIKKTGNFCLNYYDNIINIRVNNWYKLRDYFLLSIVQTGIESWVGVLDNIPRHHIPCQTCFMKMLEKYPAGMRKNAQPFSLICNSTP